MTLELNKLTQQVNDMGRELARQERGNQALARRATRLLREHSEAYDFLRGKAEMARDGLGWRAAIPTNEPLAQGYRPPPCPVRATIIAADGSQIQPDRHGIALYYLINVGSIVFEHGTGERPRVESEPKVFYAHGDLYEGQRLVQGNLLDVRRDTAEIRKLADLAETSKSDYTLSLADGTLLLWVLEEIPQVNKAEKVRRYLEQLDRLYEMKAAVASYISRPRHAEVVNLLYLASLRDEDISQKSLENNPLEGLTDRSLFSFLEPGERSALFASPSPMNGDYRAHEPSHEILFFYVNVGSGDRMEIARVEIPQWAREVTVKGQTLLDFAHAAIREQCRVSGGYPYVLARAHELAVVSPQEREELELMVLSSLVRSGLTPTWSEKERLKRLTAGGRRRHRL